MKPKGMISSDWNECLAPCGPFDFIFFAYPELEPNLADIFRQYTSNRIPLSQAVLLLEELLPAPVTQDQMDAYLKKTFIPYKGVPELIEWCRNRDILFMINTTGMMGYFQRIFSLKLLPEVPVVSAHPMVRYEDTGGGVHRYDLLEIQDKPRNTEAAARAFSVPPERIILMGDSGGDGPHFEWGAAAGAFRVSSMIKPSLAAFCRDKNIPINLRFGLSYSPGEKKDTEKEMQVDFMNLVPYIEDVLI
jgi:2-hydroxy-3-keto-5-methylthiopentenyl-1-phosphate phosphatase